MLWYVFIVLAFLFVAWLFYMGFTAGGSSNFVKMEEDLEILKGRHTRGEIDEAEYKRRKDELIGKKKVK
jgi:uncharacterized membrane protein